MADIDLSPPASPERFNSWLVLALAVALAAAGYVLAEPRTAGLPGALFLVGVAVAGIALLTTRALGRDQRTARLITRSHALALLDGTREATALTGREGELLFANRAYRARFGTMAPPHALSRSETEAADVFRLIKAGLGEGRAEGRFAAGGPSALEVKVEQIFERDGGAGLLVWRIVTPAAQKLLTDRRKQAEDMLVLTESDLAGPVGRGSDGGRVLSVAGRIVDEAPVGIVLLDASGTIREANRAFCRIAGVETAEGQAIGALVAEADAAEIANRLVGTGDMAASLELRFRSGQGSEHTAQLFLSRLDGEPDRPLILAYVVETTEQRNLELQFAQSQKMQAVGQLAGGIAHDFNNTLQAIIGFCELLLTHHPAGDPSFADIDQIRQNATRAAGLVRQLLAFSRQQTLMPTVIWLPDIVADNRMLLKRLLGERVNLEIKHERDLGLVRVDETQLIQVLMNLAVNARDAMPEGGELSIRTANVSREEAVALGHELMPPANYVMIEVSDTGCGIPTELLGKIFEPFFTTKAVGQGTGLGLSTVYGIVKQTNGFIFPESEIGKGTTFRIYLPRHFEAAASTEFEVVRETPAQDHTGRGTILLVEDEDAVRSFAARALSTRGYSVLEAANGEVALELLREHDGGIDLVISDVIMPGIDGPTLVKTVRAERPDLRIILVSGYAEDAFRKELSRDGHDLAFLPKPFSLKQLISMVKQVMSG